MYAYARPGDDASQTFAREIGAVWAGGTDERPADLDAAILFAPDGDLVPTALSAMAKGGTAVCAGIHMTDIPNFPYDLLGASARSARSPISRELTARRFSQ